MSFSRRDVRRIQAVLCARRASSWRRMDFTSLRFIFRSSIFHANILIMRAISGRCVRMNWKLSAKDSSLARHELHPQRLHCDSCCMLVVWQGMRPSGVLNALWTMPQIIRTKYVYRS